MSDTNFLCSKCGEIPEVLNIHTDNNKIELKCKICGIYEELIDDYFDGLSKNNYFKICSSCENKGIENNIKYYYCFIEKKDYCESCKNKDHSNHDYIEVDKKKITCLKHKKEFKYFCFDDLENFCEDDKSDIHNFHKNHKIGIISENNKPLLDDNTIKEVNEELEKLIKFNNLILNNEELLKKNEYFLNSIKNIGKSLEEGNKRDSKDIKFLLNGLSKDIDNSNKALTDFFRAKEILLFRKAKKIPLNNKLLNDQDFKYISQIRFNQLKEIDISENKIKIIEPFKKMSLPFLEFLNLSHNEIEAIEPVAKLKSKNLEYIFLQKNKIKDIESFLESYFPCLKILRAEDYNFNEEEIQENEEEKKKRKDILNKIDKKYSGIFIHMTLKEQIEKFKKKYKLEICEFQENKSISPTVPGENKKKGLILRTSEDKNMIESKLPEKIEDLVKDILDKIVTIDLHDLQGSDDQMLKYLFLIITYKPNNNIKELILRNTNIRNPSMLNKVNFNNLKKLDLAVNKIEDLEFLKDIRAKYLEELYLDNNNINDFFPIFNAEFENLKVLSLNNNNFEYDDEKILPAYKDLKAKLKEKKSDFVIQPEYDKKENKK